MWHEQKVRAQKALVLGRAVFIWQGSIYLLVNSVNSWGQSRALATNSLTKAQEPCLAATVIRAKHTKYKVSTSHLLLMGTEGWDVIFSMTLVLIKSERVKVGLHEKCVTQLTLPRLPWADLLCVWVSLWLLFIRGGSQPWSGSGSPVLGLARAAELIHPELIPLSSHTSWCRITAPSLTQAENGQTLNTFAVSWPSLNHMAISSGLHRDGKLVESILWGHKRLIKSLFTDTKGDGDLSQLLSPYNLYHDD